MAQHENQTRLTSALYTKEPATDGNEESTATNLAHMRAFCQENDIIEGMVYTDTAGSWDAFDQMIRYAMEENPPFQRIMTCDLAKSFGSLPEIAERLQKLAVNGVRVILVDQDPDSTARFAENIKKFFDGVERKRISDRIKRGLGTNPSTSHSASSNAPQG